MQQLNVAMVAGETSGDLLAGLLLDGLRSRWPGLSAAFNASLFQPATLTALTP